ncbi:MAG: hypothetical protein KAT15_12450 [Bacteroidales bacterium]|nr:hypothetical protein [Bacteroidales bacterium]
MKKDDLINIWQEGNDQLFREKKTDKKMITQYLSEKTLKGTRSINFNILFYGVVQIANIILLSMNLSGYISNPAMIWILIPQLAVTIGILVYGIDIFYKLREINNYSESLSSLIGKQLRFFQKPYEIWLLLSSISALILITNVNLFVDNDNGTYAINNKLMFVGVSLAALLFIYGSQKVASTRSLRSLRAYLNDLQNGVLDQSQHLERSKKKYIWLWVVIFLLLTASMVVGILTATR